jgi:hypothetical protein
VNHNASENALKEIIIHLLDFPLHISYGSPFSTSPLIINELAARSQNSERFLRNKQRKVIEICVHKQIFEYIYIRLHYIFESIEEIRMNIVYFLVQATYTMFARKGKLR